MVRRQLQQPSLRKSLEDDHLTMSEQPGDPMSRQEQEGKWIANRNSVGSLGIWASLSHRR